MRLFAPVLKARFWPTQNPEEPTLHANDETGVRRGNRTLASSLEGRRATTTLCTRFVRDVELSCIKLWSAQRESNPRCLIGSEACGRNTLHTRVVRGRGASATGNRRGTANQSLPGPQGHEIGKPRFTSRPEAGPGTSSRGPCSARTRSNGAKMYGDGGHGDLYERVRIVR